MDRVNERKILLRSKQFSLFIIQTTATKSGTKKLCNYYVNDVKKKERFGHDNVMMIIMIMMMVID